MPEFNTSAGINSGSKRITSYYEVATDAALLDHILKQGRGRTSLKHLFRDLRLHGEERDRIEAALDRLAARGEIVEMHNGHYVAMEGNREFAVGRVSVHRDGFGFLVPDKPIPDVEGDVYLSKDAIRGAMNGDRAVVRITHTGQGRTEGEIRKILRRAHPAVVASFALARRGMFVVPHDERLREWIEIPLDMAIPPSVEQVDRIGPKAIAI